jgi:hypothetical protein
MTETPNEDELHRLLTEAAARLQYVDEVTDGVYDEVNLTGAIEEVDRTHRLVRVGRRDAYIEEIDECVTKHAGVDE